MDFIILIIIIVSFLYGTWGLFTSKLLAFDLKDIEENHKNLYSRICGFALLLESIILGIGYYSLKKQYINLSIIALFLLLIPICIFFLSRKVLKKRKNH